MWAAVRALILKDVALGLSGVDELAVQWAEPRDSLMVGLEGALSVAN